MGLRQAALRITGAKLERALATVEGDGRACHTGARSCFYRTLPLGQPASPDLQTKRD